MVVVFSDLDGTLLSHGDYRWDAARPALTSLNERGIPLVFTTSKTRAEVEYWRHLLDNHHPFVVENGGAVYVPRGYSPLPPRGAIARDGYEVTEFGAPYEELISDLRSASARTRVPIRAFHELSAIEIAGLCGLPVPQAELAKRREYDEPFEVLDGAGAAALAAEVESLGRRWTRGGRFHHISGQNDKAKAVVLLIEMYQRLYGRVMTIGLGDAPNDAAFLNVVSIPVVVRSPNWHELKESVPRARVSDTEGPAGWNTEVLEILSWFPQDAGRQR